MSPPRDESIREYSGSARIHTQYASGAGATLSSVDAPTQSGCVPYEAKAEAKERAAALSVLTDRFAQIALSHLSKFQYYCAENIRAAPELTVLRYADSDAPR